MTQRKRIHIPQRTYLRVDLESRTESRNESRTPWVASSNARQVEEQGTSRLIPETPCFTRNIMATPMSRSVREQYLNAAADALSAYLKDYLDNPSSLSRLCQLTLLLPELNPSFDVYDRRFLLQYTWALLRVSSSLGMRACVLVQGARRFGAMPLSVAGLRRHFDADLELSLSEWPENTVRSGELEDLAAIDNDVDILFVLSPTNAVSIPVIESVSNLVEHARDKPIVLINPRLDEVPSHSGVMQVSGRAERLKLISSFTDVFYMRLLFDAGRNFPLRGILYKAYPSPWQAWFSPESDEYQLTLECQERPQPDAVSDSFRRVRYQMQKERLQAEDVALENVLFSPLGLLGLVAIAGFLVYKGSSDNIAALLRTLRNAGP